MQKKLLKGALASTLLLTAAAAHAQVSFGPRVGLNASSFAFDYRGDTPEPDASWLFGPQVGVTLNAQQGNLALQPSILFSAKGGKVEATQTVGGNTVTVENKARLNYIEVPLNIVYSINGPEGGFQVFAGPYAGFGWNGKLLQRWENTFLASKVTTETTGSQGTTSTEQDVDFNSSGTNAFVSAKSFDAGVNGGVGYKMDKLQVQLSYGWGLQSLSPNNLRVNLKDKTTNRSVQLTVAYFLLGN